MADTDDPTTPNAETVPSPASDPMDELRAMGNDVGDWAVAELERLQRRCEIYASAVTAIATYEGEYGFGYDVPQRIARQTLERIDRLDPTRPAEDS